MHTDPSSETPKIQTVSREAFWQRHVERWGYSGFVQSGQLPAARLDLQSDNLLKQKGGSRRGA